MSALVILPPNMEQEDEVELLIHRDNMEKEKCEIFGKTIGTTHQVKRHKKMVHSSRVKCKDCQKEFSKKWKIS